MSRNEKILLATLSLLALAARAYFAWVGQWSTDPDRGVVSLMALHMAQGRAWPVFFYGQGYMGSLEPLFSSLFVRLFGASGFSVGLGTAVPAALLVIPVYFLARRIAGPVAAFLSSSLLVIGPDTFLAYMSSPRGGYALMLLLNTLVLLLAARLAENEWRREKTSRRDWIWLGLCGGIGWWTSPMIAPALVAAGLILLVSMRARFWRPGVAWAAATFALGALPWLIWNAQHDWMSMSMTRSVGETHLGVALALLARRVWQGLGLGPGEQVPPLLAGALFVGLVLGAAATSWRRCRFSSAGWALVAISVFSVLFSLSYGLSSFSRTETLRYILPLYPPLAILIGSSVAFFCIRRGLVFVFLPILLAPQLKERLAALKPDPRRATVEAARPWAEQMRAAGVDAVFSEYRLHWLNFATRERIPVAEIGGDCVPSIDRASLLADHPAYFVESSLSAFSKLERAQKSILETKMGGIAYDVLPSLEPARPLSPDDVLSIATPEGEPLGHLMDLNLATQWRRDSLQTEPTPTVEIVLRRPVRVAGLLLFSKDDRYPLYIRVAARRDAESAWKPLVPESYVSGWYWSGLRAYYRDLYYNVEARCVPEEATQVQFQMPPSPRRPSYRTRLSEIVVLEATSNEPAAGRPDVDAVIAACRSRGARRVLTNRWVADRIGVRNLSDLGTEYSARLQRRTNDPRVATPYWYTPLTNLSQTAIFCESSAAPHNRRLLEETGHAVESVPLPGGELLVVTAVPKEPISLAWMGNLLLRDENPP